MIDFFGIVPNAHFNTHSCMFYPFLEGITNNDITEFPELIMMQRKAFSTREEAISYAKMIILEVRNSANNMGIKYASSKETGSTINSKTDSGLFGNL